MPLLKPPEPEVPKRKYYVRIEEPLAITMEKYAEFLDAKTVDHVIAEALDFVFKKDTDFKAWLSDHSETVPTRASKAARRQLKVHAGRGPVPAPDADHATAKATI